MITISMPRLTVFLFFVFIFPIACNGGQVTEKEKAIPYKNISDVPDAVWQKLSQKKIYFGHQSVGYNVLDGLSGVLKANPQIQLSIQENYDPETYKAGTITHSQIGYNGNPKSKLDMFAFFAKSGGAEKADIMFFKFCYVDFNHKSDVKAFFEAYKTTFANLKATYPKTTFVHMTVPLTTLQGGAKAWVKKMLDRPLGGFQENIKRHEFNELLRAEYLGKEPLFDLAALESTFPDGRRASFEANGQTCYYLVPEYTSDGGHLNPTAGKMIAEQLLLSLAGTL